MADLCEMINSREIDFESFLKMHPFSARNMSVYGPALQNINYYSELHIKSVMMYLRLAEISNVLSTNLKNLVIITGYRGCGKTNFLRFIEHIAQGEEIRQTLSETFFAQQQNIDDPDDKKAHKEEYDRTQKDIFATLQGAVDENDITGDKLNRYIEESLKSQATYLNFDIGGFQKNRPFSAKLYFMLEEKIKGSIRDGTLKSIVRLIDGFVERNETAIKLNFEQHDQMELADLWEKAKLSFDAANQNEDSIKQLLPALQRVTLEHLLLAFFLWEFAWHIITKPNQNEKLLYLLDNIDMISNRDGITFRNTIIGIFSYICNSRHLFSDIGQRSTNSDDKKICDYYARTNIIIAMRETSAMKIMDHDRKVIREDINNCDISEDIDKNDIIRTKIKLVDQYILNRRIKNTFFIKKTQNLKWLLQDELMIHRMIQLNNYDVRTTMQLLSKLCDYSFSSIERKNYLAKYIDDQIFGMRGVIYKHIFALFTENNYFKYLRIHDCQDEPNTFQYSMVRLILTVLYKQKGKQKDRVLFNAAEYVELKALYNEISPFMSVDVFTTILDRMYSQRDSVYWNHLVTFDNVAKYSSKEILQYISSEPSDEDSSIYISITPAGQAFLQHMCVHFEYFSVRFCSNADKALFEYNSLENYNDRNTAKEIIQTVYDAVRNCCKSLQRYNRKVLKQEKKKHYDLIRTTHYNYAGDFHEERLIHNHVSYLNAYRNYLILKATDQNMQIMQEMSTYITHYIKLYLDLLHTDDLTRRSFREIFLSKNSQDLYNKLMVCIEEFELTQDQGRADWSIDFKREYYHDHYEEAGLSCKLFKEIGIR